MTKIVLSKKLELELLSTNVFKSLISNLSSDSFDQVIADIKASSWKSLSGECFLMFSNFFKKIKLFRIQLVVFSNF